MLKEAAPPPLLLRLIFLFTVFSFFNVGFAAGRTESGRKLAGESPFTAKASFIRYWKNQVSSTNLPKSFFLDKTSPLDAVHLATFSKLADQNSLSTQLPAFCKQADLFCFPDVGTSLEKHSQDVNFAEYNQQNFTNYGTDRQGGVDSFKNYTNGDNLPVDTFRRYSRDSLGHDDQFTNYAFDANVVDQKFNTYGTESTGGTGEFSNYNNEANVPGHTFTSYSDSTNGRIQDFKTYAEDSNAGDGTFTSYGKNGNGAENTFTSYGNETNAQSSNFNNYGETGNGESDNFTSYGTNGNVPTETFKTYARGGNGETQTFTSYGSDGNVPTNNFQSYGSGGNGITQQFANYRDQSNVGDDSFQSYAQGSNGQSLGFTNYGLSFNEGTDTFKGYGKDATGEPTVDFKTYGVNNTFKDYAKTAVVTFSDYRNGTGNSLAAMANSNTKKMKSRWVEPGKFFREKMLKAGTVMPMPDIKDKMPKRSFLPRTILSKLPFSTTKINELKKIFHASDDSSLTRMMANALSECERAPSPGETKRCVGSAEDMVDFATSVLGKNVVVRSTENTKGSGKDILIGTVTGINGGQVTKSVSCHQSLYPYLLYYCHSVPKVRVYEADILDPNTKAKINHGVAICHVDTSSWSQTHGAFLALGSGPGKIEVCHWIFQNDMTWTISD